MADLEQLGRVVWKENLATLEVLDALVAVEEKGVALEEGYSSCYAYLTQKLKYSEGAANRRIRAARVLAAYPQAREYFRQREVSLCTLSLAMKELKSDPSLLERIRGMSKREVEVLLATATTSCKPVKREVVRPVPREKPTVTPPPEESSSAKAGDEPRKPTATTTASPPSPAPSAPQPEPEYRISFTVTKDVYDQITKAKAILSHKGGTVAVVVEEGVKAILRQAEKRATPTTAEPATATSGISRYIPAEVKRQVFARDGGKCCKCGSDWMVEVDHIKPLALGGRTELSNLRLLCRNHNQHEARKMNLM